MLVKWRLQNGATFETMLKNFPLFRLYRTYMLYIYVLYTWIIFNIVSARKGMGGGELGPPHFILSG